MQWSGASGKERRDSEPGVAGLPRVYGASSIHTIRAYRV